MILQESINYDVYMCTIIYHLYIGRYLLLYKKIFLYLCSHTVYIIYCTRFVLAIVGIHKLTNYENITSYIMLKKKSTQLQHPSPNNGRNFGRFSVRVTWRFETNTCGRQSTTRVFWERLPRILYLTWYNMQDGSDRVLFTIIIIYLYPTDFVYNTSAGSVNKLLVDFFFKIMWYSYAVFGRTHCNIILQRNGVYNLTTKIRVCYS